MNLDRSGQRLVHGALVRNVHEARALLVVELAFERERALDDERFALVVMTGDADVDFAEPSSPCGPRRP